MGELVLDLTRLLPGPMATRMLSQLGLDVLRLVPPQGDLTELLMPELYSWLNADKNKETLDLKSPDGQCRLLELSRQASVLIETNRPGVMEKLGVGPEVLRKENPKLTYVRIAGYRDFDYRSAPGHDLTYLAGTGLLNRFDPGWKSFQFADASGAFWAVIATLEGLRKGGGFFEVYLEESPFALAYPPLPFLDGSILCYSVYQTRQGQIALAALEPHLWERFCKAVNHPEWSDQAFSETVTSNPVYQAVSELFGSQTAQEWESFAFEQTIPLRAVQPTPRTSQNTLPWQYQP